MKSIFAAILPGMIFCMLMHPASAAETAKFRETVLHSFGDVPDGEYPYAGLIDVKGTLYGTTSVGGALGFGGAVFSLDPKTDAETIVYSLDDQPNAGLIDVKGTLYGTTQGYDGAPGTVFAVNLSTGVKTTLHTFCSVGNCADGYAPVAGLLHAKGALYGTTTAGGNLDCGGGDGCGTVFAIDLKTGAENTVYTFCSKQNCTDGAGPSATLIDVNGTLYGTTRGGGGTGCGGSGCGTVFSIDLKTGTEKTLYAFCSQQNCTDGVDPFAGLIDVNGMLYGTTNRGGNTGCHGGGCGTVYAIDPNTGAETVLYTFCSRNNCADGAVPGASLIDVNGTLYGTTFQGGGNTRCGGTLGCGTVFSLDPITGSESAIYAFCNKPNCTDGKLPNANLISVNGKFYGTTFAGGTDGYGTVFEIREKQ